MGLLEVIKAESEGRQIKPQTEEEKALEKRLNALFYLEKDIEKETAFIKHVMTRGQETAERKGLHASAIIKPEQVFCLRQQILSLFYKQPQGENIQPSLKRIFSEGDSIHEKWQRLFIRGGLCSPLDCDKTRFEKEYDLQYTPDIICVIDGVKYVVEIKSMNTFSYQKMLKGTGEHESGKLQLFLYMFLTGIEQGFTLCEDKNTQDFTVKVYKSEINEDMDRILTRLYSIKYGSRRLLKFGKIPKRKQECDCYECEKAKECFMRDVCFRRKLERL